MEPEKLARVARGAYVNYWRRKNEGLGAPEHSVRIDSEINVNLRTVVELAYGPRVALVVVVLRVDFIVHRGKPWKTIAPVLAHDVGLDGMGPGIRKIYDSADDGIVLPVEHFTGEQPALLLIFIIQSARNNRKYNQQRTSQENTAPKR
jgi:hypothetical protein